MKRCIIVVNGFYTNGAIEHQVSSITREMKNLGVECTVVKSDALICRVEGYSCHTEAEGDFAIYLDKDVHVAEMLEKSGMRIFNCSSAIKLCDDKMQTYIALSDAGVKMPLTISSPLMYRAVEDERVIDKIEEKIPYPIVVKEAYGSMGNGVHLAKDRKELIALRERFKLYPHLYQKFVGKGGRDKRVIVIGGKIEACMLRENLTDFRSNIEHGGTGKATTLTDEEQFMATTVAKVLGLDYCGIDILTGDDGLPCFCEANSNAFFRGIEAVTGVNVAEKFARHVYERVYGSNN